MINNTRKLPPAWQNRIRDLGLTTLFVLVLCSMFVAEPLAAKGLPIAREVADTLVLAVLVVVVTLSQRWSAIILILVGLAAVVVSFLLSGRSSPVSTAALQITGRHVRRGLAAHRGAVKEIRNRSQFVPQVAWSRRRPRRRREEAYSIDTATAERSENRLPRSQSRA